MCYKYDDGDDLLQVYRQCCIKGCAKGAAAPGPAVLGAHNWWEWLAAVIGL